MPFFWVHFFLKIINSVNVDNITLSICIWKCLHFIQCLQNSLILKNSRKHFFHHIKNSIQITSNFCCFCEGIGYQSNMVLVFRFHWHFYQFFLFTFNVFILTYKNFINSDIWKDSKESIRFLFKGKGWGAARKGVQATTRDFRKHPDANLLGPLLIPQTHYFSSLNHQNLCSESWLWRAKGRSSQWSHLCLLSQVRLSNQLWWVKIISKQTGLWGCQGSVRL